MKIQYLGNDDRRVALVGPGEVVVRDLNTALDLLAEAAFSAGCKKIAIAKEAVAEEFFRLSSGLAGEVLEKFVQYGVQCAIFGDYSGCTSKPLQDFLRESNRGAQVFFPATEEEALERLRG